MHKYHYMGVNTTMRTACILKCLLPLPMLDAENLDVDDFMHESTGCSGRDTIPRTLSHNNLKETGNKIKLDEPLIFTGVDYESNKPNNYWSFEVDEIRELENI